MARKRVALSSRVSRVAGREGDSFGSPEVQENLCRDFAKRKQWEIKLVLRELDVSGGTEMHKRELEEAIVMIERGELDGIVVAKIDRFSRDMLNGLLTIERIHKAGGFIVAVDDGIDTSDDKPGSMGKLWLYILLAFADWYRLQRAEGFEVVKARAVERGVHISGKVPFGYERGSDGVLIEHPDEGTLVRSAFIRRAEGESIGKLAVEFGWTTTRTSKTLKNRVYLGEARQGEHVKPDAHVALVEPYVFDVVQAKFRRSEVGGKRVARHLLAGIARCDSCGHAMERTTLNKRYRVYRCRGRSAGGKCATPAMIMQDALEQVAIERLFARIDVEWGYEPVADDSGAADIQLRIESERTKRLAFEDPDYVDTIGLAAAKRACLKVDAKIEALQDELAAIVRHQAAPWPARSLIDLWDELEVAEQREILASEVESVIVARAPRGTAAADRAVVHFIRDATAPARPSRGRKANEPEVEAGVAAA